MFLETLIFLLLLGSVIFWSCTEKEPDEEEFSRLKAVTVTLNATPGNGQVSLSWSVSGTINAQEIYRDTDSNPSGRVRIASVSSGTRSYTATGLTNGVRYYFWIKARQSSDNVWYNSNAASAIPTGGGGSNCGTATIFSGSYFMMNNVWGSGGGSQCIWFNNINSWGVNASHTSGTNIKSYPAVVRGCHWNTCSSNSGLPRQVSGLPSTVSTSWTQSSSYDAGNTAYDIWFHPTSNPGNAAAQYELMLWLNWKNQEPIAANYDANGNAIPYASNVSLGGRTWNVYRRDNVFSFRLTSQSNSISVNIKPIIDYCVARGWMSNSVYLTSIQAGWEIIRGGTFTTTAYSISGI